MGYICIGFIEFDGKDYKEQIFDGDVKYHLGWTSNIKSDKGFNIFMNLAFIACFKNNNCIYLYIR